MIHIPNPNVRRRDLLATGAAGLLASTAPVPVLSEALAQSAPSAVIDVNRARSAPIPIAVPDFPGSDLGTQIAGVIRNDLANSGLFRLIDKAAFIQGAPLAGATPNFQNWKVTGAQALVTGGVSGGGGQVKVEFRLWDILPGTQIQGTAYTTTEANWRRIAHIIADVIYERLLGEKGYFDTRIVYISSTGPRDRRTKRLAIMDQDGANNRMLTDGSWMALTPRFHPTKDIIAFMSYANNKPRVYLFDLSSGRQTLLGDFNGMTFAPRFAPDGNSVIMALTNGAGGSDIISVDLGSRSSRRLTQSGAIDVSPCYSPDGSQIVFASDRGGNQQIYVMGAGGGGARRISFGAGNYATPVWSPRGDLIAFTRYGSSESNFAIGVMRPDGSGERILSEGWDVEGPTFAPNGRVLMFYRESRSRDARGGGFGQQLVTVDITGFNERPVPTPTDASAPAWSPLGG
ncbi:Tol-Pal system beta propeller repeat protein TolB [Rhodopila sp.]|uniref:Tol-Pal system beta propeller repeat protein TolB n=1 Tax=Rhodopila sp. TaxID=2480087 RepID=UPI002D1CBBA3|nr:Tol-Pal system beta propeller repeat protein TolB [Rhodopila sp.]HVZ10417.1 Tol-Pal system beta propeller repeat protein TolB [Rhodopila sp.]